MFAEAHLKEQLLDEAVRQGWSEQELIVRQRITELEVEIQKLLGVSHPDGQQRSLLAAMRTEMASLLASVATYEASRATERNTSAVEAQTEARAKEHRENATWYTRRFYTSLGIVNAAAFAGAAAHILTGQARGSMAFGAMLLFAIGTVTAGLIPLLLSFSIEERSGKERPAIGRWAAGLTAASASALVLGLACAVTGLGTLAFTPHDPSPRLVTTPAAAPPPTSQVKRSPAVSVLSSRPGAPQQPETLPAPRGVADPPVTVMSA